MRASWQQWQQEGQVGMRIGNDTSPLWTNSLVLSYSHTLAPSAGATSNARELGYQELGEVEEVD